MKAFVVKNNFSWGEKSPWLILRKHMLNHEVPAGGFQVKLHVCPEPRSTGSTFETERSRNTFPCLREASWMYADPTGDFISWLCKKLPALSLVSVKAFCRENLCDLRKRMGCQGDECSSWHSGRSATSKSLYCCLNLPEFRSARQCRKSCCCWPQLAQNIWKIIIMCHLVPFSHLKSADCNFKWNKTT